MQIFIGNISKNINKDKLRDELEKFGKVDYIEIEHEIAYAEMPSDREAEIAISNLDKAEYDGIKLTVHKARDGIEDRRKSGRIGGRRSKDPKNYSKMFSRRDLMY